MSCPFLEPLSLIGTGLLWEWRRQEGQALYPPSFAPGQSWATSMALKDPQLGLGRTEGLERKRKERVHCFFFPSLGLME